MSCSGSKAQNCSQMGDEVRLDRGHEGALLRWEASATAQMIEHPLPALQMDPLLSYWRKLSLASDRIRTTNGPERFDRELKQRTRVVRGSSPTGRLVSG